MTDDPSNLDDKPNASTRQRGTGRRLQCSAKANRTGQQCKRWAILGGTVCATHGGRTKHVKAAAQRRVILEGARRRLNIPEHVDPRAALAEELGRTLAWVRWLGAQVDAVDDLDLIWGEVRSVEKPPSMTLPAGGTETTTEAKPSIWYDMYTKERKHLLLVAREAHAAGVEDRRVQLEERQARQSLELLRGALEALGHDMESPKVRQLVAATWRKIEAASGVVEASAVEAGK